MTQEEKDLVLKDISARLYYGVKISVPVVEKNMIFTVVGISESWLLVKNDRGSIFNVNTALEFKPYYRPISTMTEEEKEELRNTYDWVYSEYPWDDEDEDEDDILRNVEDVGGHYEPSAETYDWYNRKMFDYRGLIPKDLALSTEEFNPYKD